MGKIDLTGNSGWQSKTSDKLKEIQNGAYHQEILALSPGQIATDWIEPDVIAHIQEGELTIKIEAEEFKYETGDIILFNEENSKDIEILISEHVSLVIFKPK